MKTPALKIADIAIDIDSLAGNRHFSTETRNACLDAAYLLNELHVAVNFDTQAVDVERILAAVCRVRDVKMMKRAA